MKKTIEVSKMFGVSQQTVRNWAMVFTSHLSPSANPEKGGTRIFNDQDLQIFAFIKQCTDLGKSFEEIQVALMNNDITDIEIAVPSAEETSIQPVNERHLQLIIERSELVGQVKQLQEDRQRREEEVQALHEKIDRLNQEIGELRAENRHLRRDD